MPTAVYWASYCHSCAFLTVILNNGGWKATRACIVDVHPSGLASACSNSELGIALEDESPDYTEVAKAAANGHLWTSKVTKVADLERSLREAIRIVVEEKTSAVLDVVVR